MWAAAATFGMSATFAGAWPYLPPGQPDALLGELAVAAWWIVLGWTVLLGLGVVLRTRTPDNRVVVYTVVSFYSVVTALFSYVTGPFHATGWIAFIGGAMVGFLMFDRRVVVSGIITWLTSIGLIAYLAELGVMPLGSLVRTAVGDETMPAWLLRNGFITAILATLILLLCSAIITNWRNYEAELEQLSKIDGLTGVANRRHFMELFEHELRQARRYDRSLSCVMVDLDHFKRINDDHGHLAGDQVLVAAADAIRNSVRDTDVVGRYGGEEFVLLLPNTDLQGAREVAERCRRLISEVRINTVAVTASLGIASFPSAEINGIDDLIHNADEALYRAKKSGRDQVAVAVY